MATIGRKRGVVVSPRGNKSAGLAGSFQHGHIPLFRHGVTLQIDQRARSLRRFGKLVVPIPGQIVRVQILHQWNRRTFDLPACEIEADCGQHAAVHVEQVSRSNVAARITAPLHDLVGARLPVCNCNTGCFHTRDNGVVGKQYVAIRQNLRPAVRLLTNRKFGKRFECSSGGRNNGERCGVGKWGKDITAGVPRTSGVVVID